MCHVQCHNAMDKILEDAGVKIFTCTPKIFAPFLCDPWTRWTRRGVVSARAVTQLSLASGARWPVNSPLPRAAARRVRIHRGAATRQPRARCCPLFHTTSRTILTLTKLKSSVTLKMLLERREEICPHKCLCKRSEKLEHLAKCSVQLVLSTFLDTLEVNTGACVTVAHIINAVYRKLAVHCTVPLSALSAVDSFIARICLFKERIMVPSAVSAAVTEPQQRGLYS